MRTPKNLCPADKAVWTKLWQQRDTNPNWELVFQEDEPVESPGWSPVVKGTMHVLTDGTLAYLYDATPSPQAKCIELKLASVHIKARPKRLKDLKVTQSKPPSESHLIALMDKEAAAMRQLAWDVTIALKLLKAGKTEEPGPFLLMKSAEPKTRSGPVLAEIRNNINRTRGLLNYINANLA